MSKILTELFNKTVEQHERVEDTEEFREQALDAVLSLGLPEDEAEMLVDDYIDGY